MIDSSRLQRIETIGEGMVRRAWCLGSMVFMCLVAAANAGTPGRSAEEDRRAVLDLEHQWLDAYDAPTLDRILADDFVHPVMTGQFLSKREHIDWTVGHPPPPQRFEPDSSGSTSASSATSPSPWESCRRKGWVTARGERSSPMSSRDDTVVGKRSAHRRARSCRECQAVGQDQCPDDPFRRGSRAVPGRTTCCYRQQVEDIDHGTCPALCGALETRQAALVLHVRDRFQRRVCVAAQATGRALERVSGHLWHRLQGNEGKTRGGEGGAHIGDRRIGVEHRDCLRKEPEQRDLLMPPGEGLSDQDADVVVGRPKTCV